MKFSPSFAILLLIYFLIKNFMCILILLIADFYLSLLVSNLPPHCSYSRTLCPPMPFTPPISKFASTPKPWAAFTNPSATIGCNLLTLCPMRFFPINLFCSCRRISPTLLTPVRLMTPLLPLPLYLLSTPKIPPVFLTHFVAAGASFPPPSPTRQHH